MKSVLISIQPKWCELIANSKKTVEVRKTKPKLETPFKCYIYCTANNKGTHDLLEIHNTQGKIYKANSKVIGEFICKGIGTFGWTSKGEKFYEWVISDLRFYDKPKGLSEVGLKRPPQSWCYVEESANE